ncbi:hypothetical protein L484_011218 [Morus notabilis]|uniref:Uncharacterized protein n=1 Tax=Morus notabilis TaxID=981085 RepID=W9SAK5_9ROSA|nr:hypothetical protein L484_011218 [Morus notabilis]
MSFKIIFAKVVPLVPSKLPRLKPNYKRDLNPERFPPAGSAIGGGDEEISPLLSQVERPKINIFTVSYPRRKPRTIVGPPDDSRRFCRLAAGGPVRLSSETSRPVAGARSEAAFVN